MLLLDCLILYDTFCGAIQFYLIFVYRESSPHIGNRVVMDGSTFFRVSFSHRAADFKSCARHELGQMV